MQRRLSPSVVVTVSALSGCSPQKPSADAEASAQGSPPARSASASAAASASGAAPPFETFDKRVVVNKSYPQIPLAARLDESKAKLLNPKDASGRVVYAAHEGSCYVHVPPPADAPPRRLGMPGFDSQTTDCPAVMSDPAWDSCTHGRLLEVTSSLCACVPTFGNPPPPPGHAECPGKVGQAVKIHRRFRGRVLLGAGPNASEPLVIRSQAELEAFVVRLPKEEVQKKQPAPPSQDPLLHKPAIDFARHLVLIALRTDTMYVHPVFLVPRLHAGSLVVEVVQPPLGDTAMAAARSDVGTYAAIVIDKHDGAIRFE